MRNTAFRMALTRAGRQGLAVNACLRGTRATCTLLSLSLVDASGERPLNEWDDISVRGGGPGGDKLGKRLLWGMVKVVWRVRDK